MKKALFEVSHFLQGILVALHGRHGELCRNYETMPDKHSHRSIIIYQGNYHIRKTETMPDKRSHEAVCSKEYTVFLVKYREQCPSIFTPSIFTIYTVTPWRTFEDWLRVAPVYS